MRPANLPKLLAATAVAAVALGATPLAQAGLGIPQKHPDKRPHIIGVLKHPDKRPHIIVSDIGMPGEDGYALIRGIREADGPGRHRLPCIAVTAYAREDDRLRALAAGYDRHITKPLDPAVLLSAVADLTGMAGS